MNTSDPVSALIASMDGASIRGVGCSTCDAEVVIKAHAAPGVHLARVLHDPHCPTLAAMRGQERGRD